MPSKNHTIENEKKLALKDLEQREDMILSAFAQLRDTKKANRVKHKDVWK